MELCRIREALKTGDWRLCDESYISVKNELCSVGKIVLRGTRIVIPTSTRQRDLSAAHEGHEGITKTKQRLRGKVWWPKIYNDAEHVCRKCYACQLVGGPSPPEPLRRRVLPDYPWQATAIDLMGPFPSGESELVYVDYFSCFFENAPHTVTGVAPNKMVFKYPIKAKIPSLADGEEEDGEAEDIQVRDWMHLVVLIVETLHM